LDDTLRSLANQTWQNLQVIVVDDGSTDLSVDIAFEFARHDSRFVVLPLHSNGGAYAARNQGLKLAAGEFFTVQDSDDVAHCRRIEAQVKELVASSEAAACHHWHRRISDDLSSMSGPLRTFSSLMIRKAALERLGPWDEVRVGADAEMFRRIRRCFGVQSIVSCFKDVALQLVRATGTSATASGSRSLLSSRHGRGVRNYYSQVFRWWHENSHEPRVRNESRRADFWVPESLKCDEPNGALAARVLVVADLSSMDSVEKARVLSETNRSKGHTVALLHNPQYLVSDLNELDPTLWDLLSEGGVQLLTVGDRVRVSELKVLDRQDPGKHLDAGPSVTALE